MGDFETRQQCGTAHGGSDFAEVSTTAEGLKKETIECNNLEYAESVCMGLEEFQRGLIY